MRTAPSLEELLPSDWLLRSATSRLLPADIQVVCIPRPSKLTPSQIEVSLKNLLEQCSDRF
jgi:hypothetical protein